MTLALLLTAVTGAWAQSYEAKVFDVPASWTGDETYLSAADLPKDFVQITKDEAEALAVPDGNVILIYDFEGENVKVLLFMSGTLIDEDEAPWGRGMFEQYQTNSNAIICYTAPAEPKVAWNPATKTGNFVMPAYDVELTPIYAPVAQWAKVDNVDQLPTAIEGVYAESTDAIVKAGTVAKIGDTENPQGTVMYAVTSTNQATAPALDAFSADVPTAENITIAGDVLVWYYIKGADTPEGEKATAENTFNDSEICPEPIKVTVLSNKFDIQFKAANDNTIETGKATVKVGDEAAEVKEGKLTGVKMNSKVTVTAKEGYKFRKVEVKKGIAPPDPVTVTWNSPNFNSNPYTRDGVTLTGNASGNNFYNNGDKTFTNTLGKFTKIEIVCEGNNFDGWAKESVGSYQPDPESPNIEVFKLTWTGNAESVTIPGGNYLYGISSITFTIQ